MGKTLVLVFPGFSEFEITVVMAVLRRRAPAETVSLDGEAVVSEAGLRVAPTRSIAQVAAQDYAGIIFSTSSQGRSSHAPTICNRG